jgi:predicted regulator of amino acid metabolism with ACT domain
MYTLSYFDLGLKQNAPTQQWVLQETFTRAIKIEKEHSNFMKDIECYHQMLIDMKV